MVYQGGFHGRATVLDCIGLYLYWIVCIYFFFKKKCPLNTYNTWALKHVTHFIIQCSRRSWGAVHGTDWQGLKYERRTVTLLYWTGDRLIWRQWKMGQCMWGRAVKQHLLSWAIGAYITICSVLKWLNKWSTKVLFRTQNAFCYVERERVSSSCSRSGFSLKITLMHSYSYTYLFVEFLL